MDGTKPNSDVFRRVVAGIFGSDWFATRPAEVKRLYREYPPWDYYVSATSSLPVADRPPMRHYGIIEYSDDTFGFHTYTAHPGGVTVALDGTPSGLLEKVDSWSASQRAVIDSLCAAAFTDPFGFMVMVSAREEAEAEAERQWANARRR